MMDNTNFKGVIVVYKKSLFELHDYESALKEGNISLDNLKKSDEEHQKTMGAVKKVFSGAELIFRGELKNKSLEGYDLVVTVGGDGTLLEASHYVKGTEMFGVNSDYRDGGSEGFFSAANRHNLEEKVDSLLNGKLKKIKLNRLQLEIGGTKIKELALNDVLVAHHSPAATSRYYLRVKDFCEEQKSSGVWVCTATGSTAAARSAGGKILPLRSKKIQYVVREPFSGRTFKTTRIKGVVKEFLELESKMGKGSIFIDGPHLRYDFNLGQTLRVYPSGYPLSILGINEENRKSY